MHSDDPIDTLIKQHEEAIELLGRIEEAVASIHDSGFSAKAFAQIADAVELIGLKVRQHCEKEEQYLFPLLEGHVKDAPGRLRIERREIWHAFNDLVGSVKDVEDGRIHGTTMRELIQLAHIVVERFKSHIEKENTMLFPMAKRLLTSEDYELLRKEILTA